MIRKAVISSQVLSGLRMRYSPRSRIGQGVISLAPWLNLVLLIVFFFIVYSNVVLQPGVVVRLPEAPFTDGSPPGITAVVLSLATPGGSREEIVVFEDERFVLANPKQATRLRDTLAARTRSKPGAPLVLLIDERVSHGTVVTLMNMAREAGAKEVAVSLRPPATAAGHDNGKNR
jgi:biopolymer transport protein ExbD